MRAVGGGKLGPQLLSKQEAEAHLFGQVVSLLAVRSRQPQSNTEIDVLSNST